jgi:hypothetical protein
MGLELTACLSSRRYLYLKDAQKAMNKLHERVLRGRKLVVTPASSVRWLYC